MGGEVTNMRRMLPALCAIVVLASCGKAVEGPAPSSAYKLYEAASTSSTPIVAVIDARAKATERRLPWGTLSPDGSHFYALNSTTLQNIDPRTGVVRQHMQLPRSFEMPPATISGIRGGLSQNGRWLVLQAFDRTASGQVTASHMLLADTSEFKVAARIDLIGLFNFDAVSNDGQRVYVIEYTGASDQSSYRVRVYEIAAGQLGSYTVVDKGGSVEPMTGVRLSSVASPDGQWLYSVYAREKAGAFVHALNLSQPYAFCLDLPGSGWSSSTDAFQWSLALSADGRHLYAANGAMGVVTQINNLDGYTPTVVRTGHVGSSGPTAGLVAQDVQAKEFGPNGSLLSHDDQTLVMAGKTGVIWVDTATLRARTRALTGWTVWSLAGSPDGNVVYVLNDAGAIAALSMVDGRTAASFDPSAGSPMGLLRVEAVSVP